MDRLMRELADSSIATFAAPSTGCCTGMRVAYFDNIAEKRESICDEIAILMPSERAAFYANYRSTAGCSRRVFVRGPQISVIPARQSYSLDCQRQSDLLVIGLELDFFGKKAIEALGSKAPQLVERYGVADPFMSAVGNTLRSEFRMLKIPSMAYLESLAGVIAIHVAANYADGGTAMLPYAGLPPHKVDRVQGFITRHLTEALRLQELAATIHMSPYHFARMFKRATGQSPHVYITSQRMEHAKDLLRNSDLPLVDVAANVGFQTQGHFTTVFHKYAGVTPRVFRLTRPVARAAEGVNQVFVGQRI
jgi:AraC family transcriptional regulator